jgi:hypothetical protein
VIRRKHGGEVTAESAKGADPFRRAKGSGDLLLILTRSRGAWKKRRNLPLREGWRLPMEGVFLLRDTCPCFASPLGWRERGVSLIISRSGPFGFVLHAVVNQLIMPMQILPDQSHPRVAQQFLQPARISSRLEIPQRKAVA